MHKRWLIAAVLVVAAAAAVVIALPDRGEAGHPTAAEPGTVSIGTATTAPSTATETTTTTTTTTSTTTTTTPPAAPSLAGKIKPGEPHNAVATSYDSDGGGACLYDPSPDPLTVAMNWSDYEDSKACGAYVHVQAANGRSITVRVTNLCPQPCRVGQLDLSQEAFAMLADPKVGEIPVTWHLVSPPLQGGIAIRYKTGSSQWWCGIQVINHRNPVAALEVRTNAGWKQLSRTDYNYFLSENGAGCGGAIAVTDICGQRLEVDPLPVTPDATQPTNLQFDQH